MTTPLLPAQFLTLKNGKRLRIARLGSGPPVVLLHGYPENLQLWSRLAPLLAARFEVIAFDWPGQGYSEEWPGGATPQLLAKRLSILFEELGLERPTVVGFDMGGQPALAYAALFPEQLSRLVVMNSLVFGEEKTSWEIRLLRRFGFNRFALRYLPRAIFWRAERTFLPNGERLDAALRDDFWRAFREVKVRRFVSKMCAGYQGVLRELPELYAKIVCPTKVIWAENDKHFPMIQGQRLREAIGGAELSIIERGTHWMPIDRAREIAAAIVEMGID